MFFQTLVILAASILTDREPSADEIAMKNCLLAELAAKGSLTFANKSDLVLSAKKIDGHLLMEATISRTKSGQANFRVEAKRAKLGLDMRRAVVLIAMREWKFFKNGNDVREGGRVEDDDMQVADYLI